MAGLLDKRYMEIVDDALMLSIAKSMNEANDAKTDRDTWLRSLVGTDGVLFDTYKKVKRKVDAGEFDMNRGAMKFTGVLGFSYGAAAYVSKEARRAGYVLSMPSPVKDKRKPKEELTALFGSLGLKTTAQARKEKNEKKLVNAVSEAASGRQLDIMDGAE